MKDYGRFLKEIGTFIPKDRIYVDELQRLAWGTDAGFYRLVPKIVIRSMNEEEVSNIMKAASSEGISVTFRAAGTSLSGQAISDSVLVVAGKNWERYSYDPVSTDVTLEPGIVGAEVNRILSKYGRHFGPDPASIGSCMVGGIVMNNASGMSCGTQFNSDRMLISARLIFPDGTILDTGSPESREEFMKVHPEVIEGISSLRDEVIADQDLTARIERKYSIKNVTGLNLLPFLRFSDPFEILAHLMVGSEGTLAFMSQVRMRTLPSSPFKASAMIYFPTIRSAAEGVVAMRNGKEVLCDTERPLLINAAELLDRRSLASVHDPHLDPSRPDLTAVLTEVVGESREELISRIEGVARALLPFGVEISFSEDPEVCARYWAIRSGIFPTVGGMRKEGTTCLIEDVAFHIEDLPEATSDLSALLDRHGYDDSCIYGHALAGNFHFIINQSFSEESEVRRYEAMIKDVAALVVGKYDGSLKAEHGTGRNMAPFVPCEWGEKAFSVMKRIKELIDPQGILNPGVIFNDDPDCFLKDFKPLPILGPIQGTSEELSLVLSGASDDEFYRQINKCIECGFCEINCLSCGFTLSPRTRIVIRREISLLRGQLADFDTSSKDGQKAVSGGDDDDVSPAAGYQKAAIESRLKELERDYRYLGEETCAADGLCSTSCPMGINVAELTHRIREATIGGGTKAVWTFAGTHYHSVKNGIRGVLGLANLGRNILGTKAMASLGRGLHSSIGLPLWTPSTPRPYRIPKNLPDYLSNPGAVSAVKHSSVGLSSSSGFSSVSGRPMVVYLPSCLNQMMGTSADQGKKKRPAGYLEPDGQAGALSLKPLAEEMVELLHKAGYGVIFPKDMDNLCCGMLWESKGMPEIAEKKVRELENALWVASEGGRYPVLCDQSPCLHRLRSHLNKLPGNSMKVYEPAEFIMKFLRGRLEFHQADTPVAVHVTCTMRLMKLKETITELAGLCSSKVIIPEGVGCCGFAGDKGMTHPELNSYALRKLRDAVNPSTPTHSPAVAVGYSNSRTCEIGLSTNSGIPYVSIVYLVNSCTTAKSHNA